MSEYGKIHTDGSRSGGQPLVDSIEAKALALVNELFAESGGSPIDYAALFGAGDIVTLALLRAIEQHETYKQKVSDIVYAHVNATNETSADAWEKLKTLIIPAPKPDPLVDILLDMELSSDQEQGQHDAKYLRAKLEARGLEIREKGNDQPNSN
jgi:hypothetical protein